MRFSISPTGVLVLARGRVVAQGRPDLLGGRAPRQSVISFRLPDRNAVGRLPDELRREVESNDGETVLRTTDPTRVLARLCDWAVGQGLELGALQVARPSLEDVYLQLTGDQEGNGRE